MIVGSYNTVVGLWKELDNSEVKTKYKEYRFMGTSTLSYLHTVNVNDNSNNSNANDKNGGDIQYVPDVLMREPSMNNNDKVLN